MDGSTTINDQPSSVKWKKKGERGSNSKSSLTNDSSNSSQVVNNGGTNTSNYSNSVAVPSNTAHDSKVKSSGQLIKTTSSCPSVVCGTTEPPSPRRIIQLKKQLEKEERNQNKKNGQIGNGINGSQSGKPVTRPRRLSNLDEEEELIHLSSIELQQHYQVDQYPCTLLTPSKFNTYSSANSISSQMRSRNGSHNGQQHQSTANDGDGTKSEHVHKITWLKQLKLYLNSLRPRTFTPSLASVTLGAVLAFKATGHFDLLIFIVSCLTVLAVHGAGNLVNTYYDFVKGIDRSTQSVNQCPYRTLVDHQLSIDQVVHLGVIAYMFGCFGFVCLVFLSPARMEHLALVYFCGISCSFLYTGGLGLKYIGLGDILIMVIFGPISILFSFMSQSGYIDPATIAFALPLAFHTEAILHSNNTRDIESDQRAGAVTLAILIGPTFCHIVYALLLFIPYIMLIVSIIHYSIVFGIPLVTITKAFQLEKNFRSGQLSDIPSATASLHLIFSISYIISCCLIHPDNLPLLHVTK